jgi:hypothetical protein
MAPWRPWQALKACRQDRNRVFDASDTNQAPVCHTALLPGSTARSVPCAAVVCRRHTMAPCTTPRRDDGRA